MKKIALILMIMFSSINFGFACSCMEKSQITIKDYNETDAIFIGTVLREKTENGIVTAKFKVKKWFKGNQQLPLIYVSTRDETASCGLGSFGANTEYLIFAYGKLNNLETGLCSRTTLVPNLKLPEDSLKINELKDLEDFGRMVFHKPTNFYSDTSFLNQIQQKIMSTDKQIFYDKYGDKVALGTFLHGLPNGKWNYFNEDGTIQESGFYINGKKDSLWVRYYADGTRYKESTYELGNETNNYKYYFENGHVREEYYRINEEDIWAYKTYYENGTLKEHFIYTPAQNEKFYFRRHYENGPFKEYYDTGIIKEIGEYHKGFRVGAWEYYDQNGNLTNTKYNKTKEEIDNK